MAIRRILADFDFSVFLLIVALCAIGILNLFSATYRGTGPIAALYLSQLYWILIGLALMIVFIIVDYRLLERAAYPFYGICIFLLFLVLIAGTRMGGSLRWLNFGILKFQPSELMKIGLVVALAKYFHAHHQSLGYRLKDLSAPLCIVGLPAGLIILEPDLGTTLLLGFVAATIFLFVKIRWQSLLIVFLMIAVSLPVGWKLMLKDYQKDRVKTFLNPSSDPRGKGYHSIQSRIAVGSGGFLGKGHLKGTQTQLDYLPEQHTDFIFSVFAEEHGFLGATILLLMYLTLVLSGLKIAVRAREKFGVILGVGAIAIIFWHAFINMGMVIGILPVVGLPLPFMSYGGSSIVVSFICVGIILNIRMRRFMF